MCVCVCVCVCVLAFWTNPSCPAPPKVVSEPLSACKRRLSVTVPSKTVQDCFHSTVAKLRKTVGTIPGACRRTLPPRAGIF